MRRRKGTEARDLATDLANGNEKAFNEIVIEYGQRIYRVVRGMVSNHEDADDIVQETFLKAYKGKGGFRGDSDVGTWLMRIAINLTVSRLRRKKLFSYSPVEDYTDGVPGSEPSPEEYAVEQERRTMVREGLATLPEKQRAVFALRMYEGLSFKEIAEITGTTDGGARSSFHHALQKLKQYAAERI